MLLISNNLLIEIRFKTACDSFHCDRNKKKVSRNLTVIKVVVGRPISFMFTGRRIVEAERYLQLPFSSTFKSSRLLRTVSSWVLWISKDEGSTASLGSLWHCLTTLTVRKSVIFFCLFVYTESPVLQFVSIPLVLPSSSIFFVPAHSHIFKIPQVLFLQAEQTWLSASPHRTDAPVPQLPPHPLFAPSTQPLPLLDWEPPGTDTACQQSATTTGQGMDSTPGPAASALPNAAQGAVGLFCCKVTQTFIQNLFGCFFSLVWSNHYEFILMQIKSEIIV